VSSASVSTERKQGTGKMAGSGRVARIGILGHVGTLNLGDETIIASVIRSIRSRYPSAEITGFTINPEDTHQRHGIAAFPIRRIPKRDSAGSLETETNTSSQVARLLKKIKYGLKGVPTLYRVLKGAQDSLKAVWNSMQELAFLVRSYRNLKGTDILIIAGSQQLNDYFGGPWGFPYTLLKWGLVAKMAGTKVAFLSGGAGPLNTRLGRFFVKRALALTSYHSYRDDSSRKFIEKLGVPGENVVCPDLVFGFQVPTTAEVPRPRSGPIVGINPVPYFDGRYWPEHNPDIYEKYVQKLASFSSWLIETGHSVFFFPTQLRADPPVIEDIRLAMRSCGPSGCETLVLDRPVHSFDDLIAGISMTDFVIASRYHGVILSEILNRPVVGIAYHKKTIDLMAELGQVEYALDIQSFELEELKERFLSLSSKAEAVKKLTQERVRQHFQAVENQYDRVSRLLPKMPA